MLDQNKTIKQAETIDNKLGAVILDQLSKEEVDPKWASVAIQYIKMHEIEQPPVAVSPANMVAGNLPARKTA